MIFKFGGQLQPVEIEEWEAERSPAVFVTDARHAEETLARAGIRSALRERFAFRSCWMY